MPDAERGRSRNRERRGGPLPTRPLRRISGQIKNPGELRAARSVVPLDSMEASEYLAFVPLLVYGIALSELLGQWRRFLDRDLFYLPHFMTTVVFTELAVWNVYGYLSVVQELEGVSYRQYCGYLLQPMLFLLTVSALTPEADTDDTRAYFDERFPLVYLLMAGFIASHFLTDADALRSIVSARSVATALLVCVALTRRVEIIYALAVVWFVSFVNRM